MQNAIFFFVLTGVVVAVLGLAAMWIHLGRPKNAFSTIVMLILHAVVALSVFSAICSAAWLWNCK